MSVKSITGLDKKGQHYVSHKYPTGPCFTSTLPVLFPLSIYRSLDTVPPTVCNQSTNVYYAAHVAVTKALYSSKIHNYTTAWNQWYSFCSWLQIPPPRHQGPPTFPVDILSRGTYRGRFSQKKINSKTKRGAIHLLRGPNICSRGGGQTSDSTEWY